MAAVARYFIYAMLHVRTFKPISRARDGVATRPKLMALIYSLCVRATRGRHGS